MTTTQDIIIILCIASVSFCIGAVTGMWWVARRRDDDIDWEGGA